MKVFFQSCILAVICFTIAHCFVFLPLPPRRFLSALSVVPYFNSRPFSPPKNKNRTNAPPPSSAVTPAMTLQELLEAKKKVARPECVPLIGVVTESHVNARYAVKVIPSEESVLCTLCGKMRKKNIKVIVGDSVIVEVSVYDTTKGRIVYRYRPSNDAKVDEEILEDQDKTEIPL